MVEIVTKKRKGEGRLSSDIDKHRHWMHRVIKSSTILCINKERQMEGTGLFNQLNIYFFSFYLEFIIIFIFNFSASVFLLVDS